MVMINNQLYRGSKNGTLIIEAVCSYLKNPGSDCINLIKALNPVYDFTPPIDGDDNINQIDDEH